MGAIAEGLVAYAQPLIDQTDGSEDQLNQAFALSTLCFNLALLPDEEREAAISEARSTLKMDDAEFAVFRRSILAPMIARRHEMFPLMRAGRRQHLANGPLRADAADDVGDRRKVPWNRPVCTVPL